MHIYGLNHRERDMGRGGDHYREAGFGIEREGEEGEKGIIMRYLWL